MNFNNFELFLTFSHSNTSATLKEVSKNLSIVISSASSTYVSSFSSLDSVSKFSSALGDICSLIYSTSTSLSNLGKIGVGFSTTFTVPSNTPNVLADSNTNKSSLIPNCLAISAGAFVKAGAIKIVAIRRLSAK